MMPIYFREERVRGRKLKLLKQRDVVGNLIAKHKEAKTNQA